MSTFQNVFFVCCRPGNIFAVGARRGSGTMFGISEATLWTCEVPAFKPRMTRTVLSIHLSTPVMQLDCLSRYLLHNPILSLQGDRLHQTCFCAFISLTYFAFTHIYLAFCFDVFLSPVPLGLPDCFFQMAWGQVSLKRRTTNPPRFDDCLWAGRGGEEPDPPTGSQVSGGQCYTPGTKP